VSQQDPLANFLGDLAKKIKITKEHKDIMEAVYASASGTEIVKEQEDPFAGFLKKVGKTISEKIPVKEVVEPKKETKPIVVEEIKQEIKIPKPEEKGNEPVKTLAFKIKEAIEKAKNKALNSAIEPAKENNEETPKQEEPEDEQIAGYIDELEKIKDTGTVQQKEEAITSLKELKEYVDKTVKDYSRKILDLGSGGGTVAVQYANGGTMNGDLNINGHILSGGRNISDYFGSGGGGGDPAVNTVVYTNSGNWNSNYTTVNSFSGNWTVENRYVNFYSSQFYNISAGRNVFLKVTVNAFGTQLIFTLPRMDLNDNAKDGDILYINLGVKLGLNSNIVIRQYIYTGSLPYLDQFTELVVLSSGSPAQAISLKLENGVWKLVSPYNLGLGYEIGNPVPGKGTFTNLSASFIGTLEGNSNQWNSTYTTVNLNSAGWESVETSVTVTSGDWNSVYTTYKQLSASYVAETLAIAYAVAL
jgi:hypothetical protein